MCGSAVAYDDAAVCGSLRGSGASGLYLAYPAFSPAAARLTARTCDSAVGFCWTRAGQGIPFDDGARFYFVPEAIPRAEEGVWHVRTQTMARNLEGADRAYLARPGITTRCSPTRPWDSFANGAGYVSTDDYIDHHDGRSIEDIGTKFHFQIQDTPSTACIRTDGRAFGNLNRMYGFEDVARRQRFVSGLFSFAGTAEAATTTRYAGLSSEFAYYDRSEPPCFGFAAPRPTRTEYLGQSIDWKPYLTKIWIKRLRGRDVRALAPISVSWTP
jgi:hypothetical protein